MLTFGIVFLILLVIWLGVSYRLVPDLIRNAYRGEGPAFFQGVISGQASHRVEHYLGLSGRAGRCGTALSSAGGLARADLEHPLAPSSAKA